MNETKDMSLIERLNEELMYINIPYTRLESLENKSGLLVNFFGKINPYFLERSMTICQKYSELVEKYNHRIDEMGYLFAGCQRGLAFNAENTFEGLTNYVQDWPSLNELHEEMKSFSNYLKTTAKIIKEKNVNELDSETKNMLSKVKIKDDSEKFSSLMMGIAEKYDELLKSSENVEEFILGSASRIKN
ncbi:MAG: hypothetical protein ABIC91_00725 [Nanoarchaeota archaeon]|nr:hypothetical protein [Nanoarchaeota archaeon]MBU1029895.1 hypothetical protein [Nanoarchaeota archaeon]MBU1849818.1 hypothetical protein [Nanoarchaeota archaeon]